MDNNNIAFGWDDTIQDDGESKALIILPAGDYNFTVTDFQRGYFDGSAKVAPCPKANLTLEVTTKDGVGSCRTMLLLTKALEWKVCAFFRSIGQKKPGEPLKPNWNAVMGAQGRAHFEPRTYIDNNGNEREVNDLKWYIDYDEKNFKDTKPGPAIKQMDDEFGGPLPF